MSARWTVQDVAEYLKRRSETPTPVNAAPSKYRNKRTEVDGIAFASKREASRYEVLRLAEKAGLIKGLQTQVRFRMEVNGVKICDYVADFVYMDKFSRPGADPWKRIVEDSKGYRTPVYLLKKKLMAAIHGIEIRET